MANWLDRCATTAFRAASRFQPVHRRMHVDCQPAGFYCCRAVKERHAQKHANIQWLILPGGFSCVMLVARAADAKTPQDESTNQVQGASLLSVVKLTTARPLGRIVTPGITPGNRWT